MPTEQGGPTALPLLATAPDPSASAWPDLWVSSVLLSLYALQGLVFGLANGSLPVLLARSVSFTQLGTLALASWPFALKGLFAPLVDAYWSRRFGRRKSWVLPCTLLSAVALLSISVSVESHVASGRVELLSAQLFVCIACLAAQDVAVDAWALELLPRRHVAFASAFQTIGMSAGNVLGHPITLFVTSDAAPRAVRLSLPAAFVLIAAAHAAVGAAAAATTEAPAPAGRPGVRAIFATLGREMRTARTASIAALCALQRVPVAAVDACAEVFYIRLPGASPHHVAAFAALVAPVAVVSSVLVARQLGGYTAAEGAEGASSAAGVNVGKGSLGGASPPAEASSSAAPPPALISKAYAALVVCGAAVPLALVRHRVGAVGDSALLVLLAACLTAANKLWWTTQACDRLKNRRETAASNRRVKPPC